MTYRPYTDDELPTCLGMRVKHVEHTWFTAIITSIKEDRAVVDGIQYTPKELVKYFTDLSTGQPCGVLDLEKGELPR